MQAAVIWFLRYKHTSISSSQVQRKLDKAMVQIDEKGYLIPYECDGRKLVKVSLNFNETIRTIDGWRIGRGDGTVEEWYDE